VSLWAAARASTVRQMDAPPCFARYLESERERLRQAEDAMALLQPEKKSNATRSLHEEDEQKLHGKFGARTMKAMIHANLGAEGADAWKQARMTHCLAWQLPSTLLMTTAFSFVLHMDALEDEPLWKHVLLHVYMFSMTASGFLSLKSVNDFLQEYLCLCNLPSKKLPDFYEHRNAFICKHP